MEYMGWVDVGQDIREVRAFYELKKRQEAARVGQDMPDYGGVVLMATTIFLFILIFHIICT